MIKRLTGTALLTVGIVVGLAGAAAASSVTIATCTGAGGTAIITSGGGTCSNPGGRFDGWALHGY